jgi:hypothetical protein
VTRRRCGVAQLRESRIATRTTARHGDQSYETKRTILKVPLCVLRLTRGGKTEPWRAGSLKRPKGMKERENTNFGFLGQLQLLLFSQRLATSGRVPPAAQSTSRCATGEARNGAAAFPTRVRTRRGVHRKPFEVPGGRKVDGRKDANTLENIIFRLRCPASNRTAPRAVGRYAPQVSFLDTSVF